MYDQSKEKKTKKTGSEKAAGIFTAVGGFIFSSIEAIVVALAISVVLYLFIMTPHEVVGRSMIPNFQNGEYLIANKLVYRFSTPKRGEVVIFKYSETQDFIKRIVALPGETVSIQNGKYYVDGKLLDESKYLDSSVFTSGGDSLHEGSTITVPEGEYFVSGDNRPHSSDSRAFGSIERTRIKGRAWIVYFPFEDFRFIKHALY